MPLPKEYYDIIKTGDKTFTSPSEPIGISPTGIYRAEDPMEESQSAWGSVGDFLWSAGEGFTSGMTWGLTDLGDITGQEPWEEMSSSEKAGWILGEGASFFAPWGPFGLMAKGTRALTKAAGNKFVGEAAQQASENVIANLSGKTAKAAAKAQGKGVNFDEAIKKGLDNAAQDDLGVQWIRDLNATGEAALNASDNLVMSGARAVQRAFKEAGLPDVGIDDAAKISGEFVESLKGGRYVNDITDWVARELSGRIPDTASGAVSKYLGMLAQDWMFLGIHGLANGKIKAMANNEEFDLTGTLSHGALTGLAFPLVRLTPNLFGMGKGGMATASQGIKAYMNQFKKTNYKEIADVHGEDVVKNMLKVMVRGQKKDLWSRSKLGDAHWKAGGKVYTSSEQIERAIPNMKLDDAITLLNKMNKTVNKEIIRKWGPEFILDTVGSIPRMGLGVLTMNPWILQKDAWGSMEGPELASHLFMSAVMTRGRGEWGHTDQRAYMADFTPYHEALNLLGVNTKNVKDVLRFHEGRKAYEGMGVALGTHETGVELVDIFDAELKNAESRPNKRDFRNDEHSLVVELSSLYNVIKGVRDPNFNPINASSLDAKTLNTLASKLSKVQFADGNTIGDIGFEGALVRMTLDPAKRGLDVYKNMLTELSKLGLPISVIDGRVVGTEVISTKEGKSIDDVNTVNRVLEALGGINEATYRKGIDVQSEGSNYEKIVNKSGFTEGEFNLKVREIIDNHMDILGTEYGDKNIYRDPVADNPMWEFFKQAKGIESSERVYNIVTGKFPAGDPNRDKILTDSLDSLFKLSDGKYASSVDSYKDLFKQLIKDPKTDKDKAANELILENLNDLRQLFELRKITLGGVSSKSVREKGELSADGLEATKANWQDIYRGLPIDWKTDNWHSNIKNLYIERFYKLKGYDRRALNLIGFMAENNLILPDGQGKMNMPSKKAFLDELRRRKMSDKEIDEYSESIDTIKQVLGDGVVREVDWVFTESGKRQLESVDITNYLRASKMLSNKMFSDLLVNTQSVLGEISSKMSGTRKKINDLYIDATNILESLDPANNKRPVENPVKALNELKDQLVLLEQVAQNQSSKDDLGSAIVQLHDIIGAIDSNTKKFNLTPARILTDDQKLMGDQFGVDQALIEPLQSKLEKIFNKENEGINALNELVVRLENLTLSGKSGLGLDKSETSKIIEDLSREWFSLYKGEKGKGVKVLSELITEVNEKGYFGDAVNLLETVNARINREIIIKNEHHPLNEDGVRMAEALEDGYKTHEHHRTVTEIIKDYGLVDKDGKIKDSFKRAIVNNPFRALNENIKQKIYDQKDKSLSQKAKEWRDFREKDAIELLTNIYNSTPINKAKIIGITRDGKKRGIVEFNNNSPHIQHPNTQYMLNKGYKVHWLEDTMSADIGDGRLRNVSLDEYNADTIQNFLNDALRTDSITREILDGFKSIDYGISEKDVRKILQNPSEYVFFTRLSPMDKVMFVATEKNLKLLDSDFQSTYDNIASRLSGKEKTVFEGMFKDLLDSPNTSRSTVELKLLLPYLEGTGKSGEVDKMIAEYAGDARPSKLAKIQANMFKRGFLSDGGTTQPIRTEVLQWVRSHHPNTEIKNEAKRIIQNGGYVAGVLADGAAEGGNGRNHPLNIENLEMGQLQVIGNQAKGLLKELAINQQKDAANQPSLLSSVLDGGKFASERLMKLMMAQKGMLDTDFSNSPNGAKTIIFAVGDNQMLGKGYLIYHPDIAKHMPKDVDVMLGETSAKIYKGKALDGKDISAYDISGAGPKWQPSVSKMGNNNKMLIPVESIGVSFTSKNESGVAISPSIFDFQPKNTIKAAVDWMSFESKLQQIGTEWNSLHKDGAKLATWLYEIGRADGNPLDKGDTGLTGILFEYGAMPNNPLVQKALRRLLRSSNYKHLSKMPNQRGGEDNFIVPNINGDLSIPIYAEFNSGTEVPHSHLGVKYIAVPGEKGRYARVTANYGGIGLNTHTSKRQLGNGIGNNLEGERFIFRDANGIDVVLSIENGKYQTYSSFYDAAKSGEFYKGVNAQGGTEYQVLKSNLTKVDKASLDKAIKQLDQVKKLVNTGELNFADVHRLLAGEIVSRTTSNGITNTYQLPIDQNLKMQLGVLSHAVPVIGHDKVILRVEKIMDNMQGLAEVNVHDLRTVMQRDNDGDHLFTHTRLPWEVFKSFAKENGRKDDFRMFEREQVLNNNYINIFGVGENGKANANPEAVGFQNYASKLHHAKKMTGEVIGARNAISWLNRLGFKVGDNKLLKDLIDVDMTSDGWKTLDKFYDTVQNALDIHGGIHESLSNRDQFRDFLYFGHRGEFTKETGDPVFDKHNKPELNFFNDSNFGTKRIHREMFYEILRTLRKSNMIQNDTWDERGSRSPEPSELRDAYYNMRGLFANPTQYLARQLARKIGRIRNADERNALISEYADFFYKDTVDIRKRNDAKGLYYDILKGNIDNIMKPKFSYNPAEVPPDNPEKAFEASLGGDLINKLLRTNGFWDTNYEGLAVRGEEVFNKAGFFVKNIENFVETARMFGDDPVATMAARSISIDSFDTAATPSNIRKALNNGILRELIHRQHGNVMNQLDYLRAEPYGNPNKVEQLQNRLLNLQKAVDIMDQQIAKDMVINREDNQIISAKRNVKKDFNYLGRGQKVAVYRVRGDVKVIDKVEAKELPSLYNYGVDGSRLNYGQLEYVGLFNNKSKPFFMRQGYTYIVDNKPKEMISQSGHENRYSMALFKATYGNDIIPERFINPERVNDFRDSVRALRASISMDYIKTVKEALSSRVLSDGIFALQDAKEGRQINEFVQQWESQVIGSVDPINALLRYVLQPQIVRSKYFKDADGLEMPTYKTNEHLYKRLLQWSINNGHKDFVKDLVKDVEQYAKGEDTEVDIGGYERGKLDKFDYSELGKMADPVRTLAKHLNVFFASPVLNAKLDKVIDRSRGQIENVKTRDGKEIPLRRVPEKGEYWKIQTDQTGEPC